MAVHSTAKKKGSADKRDRILRAAIKVFAKNGFYATRVSEIAKAAGVADGTIYLYFKNKDDVLITIFEDGIQQLLAILREVAASEQPFDERITRIIELQLGLLEDQRDLAEVITVNLRQSSSLLKQYATPLFMEYIDVIAGLIRDGAEGRRLPQRHQLACGRAQLVRCARCHSTDVGARRSGPTELAQSREPLCQPLSRRLAGSLSRSVFRTNAHTLQSGFTSVLVDNAVAADDRPLRCARAVLQSADTRSIANDAVAVFVG